MTTPMRVRANVFDAYAEAPLSWHEWNQREENRATGERAAAARHVAAMREREDSDLLGDHYRDLGLI